MRMSGEERHFQRETPSRGGEREAGGGLARVGGLLYGKTKCGAGEQRG